MSMLYFSKYVTLPYCNAAVYCTLTIVLLYSVLYTTEYMLTPDILVVWFENASNRNSDFYNVDLIRRLRDRT